MRLRVTVRWSSPCRLRVSCRSGPGLAGLRSPQSPEAGRSSASTESVSVHGLVTSVHHQVFALCPHRLPTSRGAPWPIEPRGRYCVRSGDEGVEGGVRVGVGPPHRASRHEASGRGGKRPAAMPHAACLRPPALCRHCQIANRIPCAASYVLPRSATPLAVSAGVHKICCWRSAPPRKSLSLARVPCGREAVSASAVICLQAPVSPIC